MKRLAIILWISAVFVSLPAAAVSSSCMPCRQSMQREMDALDRAIDQLHYQRLLYRSKALWYSDEASRLQNKRGFYLETRRAYKEAQLYWDAVAMIEVRIYRLKKHREEFLR